MQLRGAAGSGFLDYVFHDVPGILDWVKVLRVSWPIRNSEIVVTKVLLNYLRRLAGSTVMHKKNHSYAIPKMEAGDSPKHQCMLFASLFD